jgi:serine/threonine-protein kinase
MTTLQPGELIDGKYRVVKLIGQGGMGAVYEGNHELIDRRVAIKVLLPMAEQAQAIARFEREARAAGRIGNDHILEVLDIGSIGDGSRYMVMEFLDGDPLSKRIEERLRLSAGEAARIALQLLDGLGAAHAAGVLHRDLKPDNIFLVRQKAGHRDFVKIIDFGISKFQVLGQADEMRMTATGIVVGTPYYISPEQAKGLGDVDHRNDLYAVGVILFEALSGRVPFLADNFNNLLFKIVLEEAPQLATLVPDIDPEFAAIVHRGMARDRNDRYASAEDFAGAIRDWMTRAGVALDGPADAARAAMPSVAGATAGGVSTQSNPAMLSTMVGKAMGSTTPGAFGASQPIEPVVVPKKKAPIALFAAGGVGLVAVIGTIAALSGGGSPEPSSSSAAASSQVVAEAPAERPAAPAPPPAVPAPVPSPAPEAPSSASSTAPAPAASPTEPTKPAKATTRSRAVAPPAPATAPAPQPAATSKRRNFGY